MNDQAIEFNSLLHKIEVMISNIEKLEIDTEIYKEQLKEIVKEVETKSQNSSKKGNMSNMFLIQDYTIGIKKLKDFEIMLSKYDVYFKALKTCQYIDTKINISPTLEELKWYVFEITTILKNIKLSETMHYERERKVVEKIYDTAYKLIKIELLTYNESKIYDYGKLSMIDIYYFDRLIKKDLKNIDLDSQDKQLLKEKIYYIDSQGLASSYFDLELIKLLTYQNDSEIKDSIIKKLNEIVKDIEENNSVIKNHIKETEKLEESIYKTNKKKKRLKSEMYSTSISLLVSLGIVFGGVIGSRKLAKKWATSPEYQKTTTTYSELTGETKSEEFVLKINEPSIKNSTTIKIYDTWNDKNNPTRTVKEYDLSYLDLDNISEYLELELVEKPTNKYTEYLSDVDEKRTYDTPYKVIEQIEYTKTGEEKLDKLNKGLITVIGYFVTAVILLIKYMITDEETVFEQTGDLIDNVKDLLECSREKTDNLDRIKEKITEILNIINSNEELRKTFNKLYEENKFLLHEEEKLYQEINNLETKLKTKEYIKDLKVRKLIK